MSRGRGATSHESPGPPLAQVAALALRTYRDATERGGTLESRVRTLDEGAERGAVLELYAAERARAEVARRLLADIWGIRVGADVATDPMSGRTAQRAA